MVCSGIHAPCRPAMIPAYSSETSPSNLHHPFFHFPRHLSLELIPNSLTISHNQFNSKHKLKRGIRRFNSISSVSAEAKSKGEPLKVMISGAPASGKGTQCELIAKKFGLIHIATGDLLRAEVAAGTENGRKAKEYMEKGLLVPDEIVVTMVKGRLAQQDVREKGWLLDGYPRSLSQAEALENLEIRPDLFLILDVPKEILVERVVGRRLDPITGKIYHLKYFPPETEEIATRLTQRFDDTEAKVRPRLQTYQQNVEAVISVYKNIIKRVDGSRPKEQVFEDIDALLGKVLEGEPRDVKPIVDNDDVLTAISRSMNDHRFRAKSNWKGIPTKLNNIPHSREIREYFYEDVRGATTRAIQINCVEINIPELNPDMDVYRIGTLMELIRVVALTFADDGKRVKVCVQGSMGEGVLLGMPLQLAGTRHILESMDWGEYDAMGTFINIGSIGAKEVDDQDDMFMLVAPQNAMGNCIINDLQAMVDAAGHRPVILFNPRLKDLPSAGGVMQTIGRDKRLEFAASFTSCYLFRLLYEVGTLYPIVGALRMSYPYPYEIYKRIDIESGKEKYVEIATFSEKPTSDEINDAFDNRLRRKENTPEGIWGLLSRIF